MLFRSVDLVDIVLDELQPKHYKETEDPKLFNSVKTQRGPLNENWKEESIPIMCSYKLVQTSFEVWGLQTRVEDYTQKVMYKILDIRKGRFHQELYLLEICSGYSRCATFRTSASICMD